MALEFNKIAQSTEKSIDSVSPEKKQELLQDLENFDFEKGKTDTSQNILPALELFDSTSTTNQTQTPESDRQEPKPASTENTSSESPEQGEPLVRDTTDHPDSFDPGIVTDLPFQNGGTDELEI